jgi:hypothetical protein
MKQYDPDNVSIDTLSLTSPSGRVQVIGPQALAIRIQEDILSPYVTAEVDLMDGINLLQTFPIIGEETLDIEFVFDHVDARVKYKFAVYAVSNLKTNQRNNATFYTLKCISSEVIQNAATLIEKSYKAPYSDIIDNIVKQYLKSSKPVFKDPTLGVQEVTVPNTKPLQAIDMLRLRSTSVKFPFSPMLFFETKNGFYFKDLVSLFEDQKKKYPRQDITFDYGNVGLSDATNNDKGSVLFNFIAPERADIFQQLNDGAFNNKLYTFDLMTKKVTTNEYSLADKMKTFEYFNKSAPHTTAFVQKYSNKPSRTYFVPVDSSRPNFHVDRFGDKRSYANLIFQQFSHAQLIGLAGKRVLSAGDAIYVNFSAENNTNGQPELDKGKSGYYMIKKVVHEIQISKGTPIHRMSCDLMRGSLLENIG